MPYDMTNRSRRGGGDAEADHRSRGTPLCRDDYSATSIDAIAAEAGVATPTVYASLRGAKPASCVRSSTRGSEAATNRSPCRLAPSGARWRPRTTHGFQLALFARLHRDICDHEASLFAQLDAAAGADADAAGIPWWRKYVTQSRLARRLRRRGRLRAGLAATGRRT